MTINTKVDNFDLTEGGALRGTTTDARRQLSPARAKALTEAAELWGRAWRGDRRAAVDVVEALTTDDLFVSATGDLLDREMLRQYQAIEPSWQPWASPTRVRNFKPKTLVDIMGGRTMLDAVPELTEYPYAQHRTNEFTIQVAKYGRRFGFSWEAGINDDIDELRQIPGAFAFAAARTEALIALSQIATVSTGAPNSSFFKSYNASAAGQLGYKAFDNSGSDALTADALEAALVGISQRKDYEGNPVPHSGLILMVGPALQFTAERILNSDWIRRTNSNVTTQEPNYLRGAVRLVVNQELVGTSWFILPDPARAARPAVAVAKLIGYESPDLRVSDNTGRRPGGGDIPATEGDFEVDGVWYRVRHVVGAAHLDPIHTYGSTGQGSGEQG